MTKKKAVRKKAATKKTAAKKKPPTAVTPPEVPDKAVTLQDLYKLDGARRFYADVETQELISLAMNEGKPLAQECARRLQVALQRIEGMNEALQVAEGNVRDAGSSIRRAALELQR